MVLSVDFYKKMIFFKFGVRRFWYFTVDMQYFLQMMERFLMQTLQEAVQSIQILSEIANDCGLSINKNKSNIIIFNSKNQNQKPEYIEDIHVTTNITYLGVKIQNNKDCYKLQRIEASKKAKKYTSMMPAVIVKSCNEILIGKNLLEMCSITINTTWNGSYLS